MGVRGESRPAVVGNGATSSAGGGGRGAVPVDRGWAWVIMAASCGIFGLQGGSFKITGLIYVQMVERFGGHQRLITWVISGSILVALTAGPAISLLLSKTSHRLVALLGSALITSGIISTAYVPVVEATFFTYVLIHGVGLTCLHISSLTCSVPYFNKHRGLALGVISAGSGVMSFVLPNVMTALFEAYTFSGAMLIYAGIYLQTAVLSCLLRPTSVYTKRHRKSIRDDVELRPLQHGTNTTALGKQMTDKGCGIDADAQARSFGGVEAEPQKTTVTVAEVEPSPTVWVLRTDSEQYGAVKTTVPQKSDAVSTPPASAAVAKKLFDCSLLKSERMWIIGLVMLFAASGMNIVFIAMAPHGEDIGLPRATTSMLISIGGALEIVCRGLHGWFSDRHLMPVLVQFGLCTGLTGMSAVLCPIIGGEVGLGLLAAMCGACGTTIYALVVVVMRELLGADKVTSAMGIQMLFQAASLVLSTLAMEFITETYGAWEYVFYYIGGSLILSSALCMAYSVVLKARENRNSRK